MFLTDFRFENKLITKRKTGWLGIKVVGKSHYVLFCFVFYGSKQIGFIREKESTEFSAQTLTPGRESPQRQDLQNDRVESECLCLSWH